MVDGVEMVLIRGTDRFTANLFILATARTAKTLM